MAPQMRTPEELTVMATVLQVSAAIPALILIFQGYYIAMLNGLRSLCGLDRGAHLDGAGERKGEMTDTISRREVEAGARDYLERVQRVGSEGREPARRLSPDQFEEIVQHEVAITIRQLRGVGRVVED